MNPDVHYIEHEGPWPIPTSRIRPAGPRLGSAPSLDDITTLIEDKPVEHVLLAMERAWNEAVAVSGIDPREEAA
ncbi:MULTISPECIES: hypothetical protein [Mycobacteroides]|uniref:Uncharacterized protein n=1 Tax=Mycobacteroides franklinii TaxID=948102 RepID=A0A4R5PGE6_9MYCO|nr:MULTISPECIES: hypothetical protein [Mycobacteroides]AMU71468.1 hypothetical protein A3O05_16525 [Mycobacteroides abscessus]MDM2015314.1 hypothetical protein [Mycobacteroides abscessus]MDM2019692.1 hypothetical protein [Mycobacteroides abscessus]MDM2025099.1 hypothetical protein [Mycobacteroides abscessus]MDM2027770.1 hypothetical protein [Mycobacteroides abscessus]